MALKPNLQIIKKDIRYQSHRLDLRKRNAGSLSSYLPRRENRSIGDQQDNLQNVVDLAAGIRQVIESMIGDRALISLNKSIGRPAE